MRWTIYVIIVPLFVCIAPALAAPYHSADTTPNYLISLSELLRVIQFYNVGSLHCDGGTEDGFAPGVGETACAPHNSDYAPQNWVVNLSELLRLIQIYNIPGYHPCEGQGTEDGYCPGLTSEGEGEGEGEGVVVSDTALEAALRLALDKPEGPLLTDELAALPKLNAAHVGISNLEGIEACTALTELDLAGNCIADLGPLVGLTSLERLNLHGNAVADVSPLAALENLQLLWLDHNQITDPAPLLDNPGLGNTPAETWDRVALAYNPLDAPGAAEALAALRARGVAVWSDAPDNAPGSCASPYAAGDPNPIDVHLIYGDPTLDDAQAFVLLLFGDAYTEALLDDPGIDVAATPPNGFSSAERTWSESAADAMHFLFTQEPFTEYAAYFKVYRVDLISNDGTLSDNRPVTPLVYDTALHMANESLAFSFDSAQLHRLADATSLPWDHIILLPNANGSGKNVDDVTMFSNARASRTMTGLHELGHGLGKLTDEYEYRHGTNPPTSEPPGVRAFANAISMGADIPQWDDIPWKHWIEAACDGADSRLGDVVDFACLVEDCQCSYTADYVDCVPLPSCEPGGNFVAGDGKIYGRMAWPEPSEETPVGLYEGAWFRSKGAYRPELRCRMRSDDDVEPGEAETPRFCKVCREALTLEIVSNTGSATAWSPPNNAPLNVGVDDADLAFSVLLHAPATPGHLIEVLRWEIDGMVQGGETGTSLVVDPGIFATNTQHEIAVVLADRSPFVLANYVDGQARLQQRIAWALAVQ